VAKLPSERLKEVVVVSRMQVDQIKSEVQLHEFGALVREAVHEHGIRASTTGTTEKDRRRIALAVTDKYLACDWGVEVNKHEFLAMIFEAEVYDLLMETQLTSDPLPQEDLRVEMLRKRNSDGWRGHNPLRLASESWDGVRTLGNGVAEHALEVILDEAANTGRAKARTPCPRKRARANTSERGAGLSTRCVRKKAYPSSN
jgi:hypothetical protein